MTPKRAKTTIPGVSFAMLSGIAHYLLLGLPWHYKYIFDHIHYNNHIFNKDALNVQFIMNVEFNIILQNTEK